MNAPEHDSDALNPKKHDSLLRASTSAETTPTQSLESRKRLPLDSNENLPLRSCLICIIAVQAFALAIGFLSTRTAFGSGLLALTVFSATQLIAAWSVLGPGSLTTRIIESAIAGAVLLATALVVPSLSLANPVSNPDFIELFGGSYLFWLASMIPFATFRLFFGWRMIDISGKRVNRKLSIADLMLVTVVAAVGGAILSQTFNSVQPSVTTVDGSRQASGVPGFLALIGIVISVYSVAAFIFFSAPALGFVLMSKNVAAAFNKSLIYCGLGIAVLFVVFLSSAGGFAALMGVFMFGTMLMLFFVTPLMVIHMCGVRMVTRWTDPGRYAIEMVAKRKTPENSIEKTTSPFDDESAIDNPVD